MGEEGLRGGGQKEGEEREKMEGRRDSGEDREQRDVEREREGGKWD